MILEARDPRLASIIDASANLEQLGSGFLFTEGPLWHPQEKFLLFSDMPGSVVRRWDGQKISVVRQPSNMANGQTYDRSGRLLTCEHETSRVTRTEADGRITTIASHYNGKELNSPNDIVVSADGDIYFTDPTFGRAEFYGVPREPELAFRGVYRVQPDGAELTLLIDDFDQPNGLCFSLDGKRLFVNDTMRQHIRVFDVAADGRLSGGSIWAETVGEGQGGPDGMKIDSAGNVYCCGPGGIHIFDPDAACLGVIRVPEIVANFTFGDDDYRSLFITASTSLYRIRVETPGLPVL